MCVSACVCVHRSVSSGKLGCAKDFWESLGGETKHSGCSVWNSILCWRAIIYPLGVWVTYRLCVTKGCELQDRVITEHCRASWACVSCHTFPLKWKTSVLIWLCIIILNIEARGAYLTPGVNCCVSGHWALFTNHWFCCTTAKDTRRGFASSRAILVWRQQTEGGHREVSQPPNYVFVISQRCQASRRAPGGHWALANSTGVANSNLIHRVIFIFEMLEWVIRWLIEEDCCPDRILTRTQLAACQRGWLNDIWVSSLKTKQKPPTLARWYYSPHQYLCSLIIRAREAYPSSRLLIASARFSTFHFVSSSGKPPQWG